MLVLCHYPLGQSKTAQVRGGFFGWEYYTDSVGDKKNSVRISHLIETASSTFVFGIIVTWLTFPRYTLKTSNQGDLQ
jgi:hypothetical protein